MKRKAAKKRAKAARPAKNLGPRAGTNCIWPKGVQERYGISAITRWRWETSDPRKLPARDVFLGGVAVGWRPETLDAHERNQTAAA
jgi:hypothetical protein